MPKLFLAFRQGLLLLVLLTGWLGFPSQIRPFVAQPKNQDYSGGHILIKFAAGIQINSGLHTGNSDLDRTLAQARVKSLVPVYSQGQSQPIYRLELAAGADLGDALALLQADRRVTFAEPDYLARLIAAPNDPRYADQWGLSKIQAQTAWDQTQGSATVIIAVIDSGIDLTHPDLAPNLWVNPGEIPNNGIDDDNNGLIDDVNGWNFIDGTNNVQDLIGHGSLVAGVAAARSNNGVGIAGVCGLCRIMPVKITQTSGFANYSDIAAGINYAVAKGAKVINLSVGGYADSQAVHDAVTNALNKNVVIVGGAGNDNKSDPFYPAAYDGSIAVSGTDAGDLKVTTSNFGTWVDLSAPGQNILSTTLGDYSSDTGTSYATPFVAGTAGLLFSLHPDWTAAMVRAQLIHTADPVESLNPGLEGKLGTGRLNAASAMQLPHPILTYQGYAGNGTPNLRPDFGSSVSLSVTLSNDWADAGGVSAILSSTDPFVTVTAADASFGGLLSGQSKANTAPFEFNVAAGAGYNHAMPFSLEVSANGGTYSTTLHFTITTRSSEEVFSGTIDTDTLWTNDKTYKLTGNVGVDVGATLTIQAGTVVKFAGNYSLTILGTLIAQGTANQPIRFEPYTNGGNWNQMIFDDSSTDAQTSVDGTYLSGNLLQFVTVSGAADGIACSNATPYLSHLTTSGGGITCGLGSSPLWLMDSTLSGTVTITQSGTDPVNLQRDMITGGNVYLPAAQVSDGVLSGSLTIQGDGSVIDTTFGSLSVSGTGDIQQVISKGNISIGTGQVLYASLYESSILAGAGSTISNCTIIKGGISAGAGSTLSRNDIENSPTNSITVSGSTMVTFNRVLGSNGTGILAEGGSIQNNLIANTLGDGIRSTTASIQNNTFTGILGSALTLNGIPTAFDHNNFEFNPGSYDVTVTVLKTQTINLPAQNNWWGTTDGNLIKQRTWDYYDDIPLAKLITTLPLSGPSQTAPAYVRGLTLNPSSPVGVQTVTFTATFSRPMDPATDPQLSFQAQEANTWTNRADMPTPRTSLGLAAANGIIYAVGGNGTVPNLGKVEAFDPITNTWTARATMLTRRFDLGVVSANGKIYAIGGTGGSSSANEEYNPVTDTWLARSNMPTPRYGLGVAEVNGKIYAIGGTSNGSATLSTVEEFDPSSNTWRTRASMPTPRSYMGVAVVDNKIYAIGGWGGGTVVEEYNPVSDTWIARTNVPLVVGYSGAAAVSGKIYALASSSGGPDVIEEYNPADDTWTTKAGLPTPRFWFGVTALNGKVYAIGGYDASGIVGTVGEYTPPGFQGHAVVGSPQWLDATHYSSSFDVNALVPRGLYLPGVQNAVDPDGMQIVPYTGPSFQVDYAGEISSTTPPAAPSVLAWGNSSLSQLSAHVSVSGTAGTISGYRYAIGTTPGGIDVVNWTNTVNADVIRTGLILQPGQTYYVSCMVRNAGGLWSPAGVSNGVKDGKAIQYPVFLPSVRR